MRIIAGKYKNKKIVSKLRGISLDVKPTTSKVREAVFNIIFNYLEKNDQKVQNYSFLDLCCGTGAIGIEAISRGFVPVYFVDQNKDSVVLTKYNLSDIENNNLYTVVKSDVIKLQISPPILFDVVYLDPPYNSDIIQNMLSYITQFTHPKSLIMLEISKNPPIIPLNNYHTIAFKDYSNCAILSLARV